jgi:hypothetical protein
MANTDFMAAYTTIGTILYQAALNHPKLANATVLPPESA